MKKSSFILLACTAAFFLAGCAHTGLRPTYRPGVEQELRRLENEIVQVYLRRDVALLEWIFAPEWTFTHGGGQEVNRGQEIEKLRSGKQIINQLDVSEITVRDYGRLAVVTMRSVFSGTENGRPISGDERVTDVFVRRDGRWQCVKTTATPIKP